MSWPKMYVLVREDLPLQYASVQAGHAATMLIYHGLSYTSSIKGLVYDWSKSKVMIYLGINDRKDLCKWMPSLVHLNIPYTCFVEPDIGNQETALACILNKEQAKLFKDLPLKK